MPVFDASVVVDCIAPDVKASSPAMRALERLANEGAELLAPRLLLTECSNALLVGVKRKRWSGAAADTAYMLLVKIPIRLADDALHMDRAWELSRRYDNHPIYDMLYVAVAERAKTTLVTADETLRERLRQMAWIVAPDQFASA
ncbi:MAG TPA: type II toxin-antitoxin system VapC family toxin [Candidatus Dormibacteraeota bacterium]|nr:type II toxin-antitoxin system VapC family toxin [Candidatus Dormibacteraeota bacterium]